tara:strand:+ start:780 stop:1718 length:939 start_codon:yes stop_codon:yes gene_type:complete
MIKTQIIYFLKIILVFFLINSWLYAQEDTTEEELPFDAVIQSTLGGKRVKFYGNTRLNFNQAYFSNWISGGESAMTVLFGLDYNLDYSYRNGLVWDNKIILSLGTTYISGDKFLKKADDRFEISSLVGKQISPYWSYSSILNFKTQLLPGYRYYSDEKVDKRDKVSQILSPAYVQLSLGWNYEKVDNFWINMSPLSVKVLLVSRNFTDDLLPESKYFGVGVGKSAKLFLGAAVNSFYKTEILKNIFWENKLSIYLNYLEKQQNIDFDWDTNIRFKVNDKISGNFIMHLLYDDDLVGKLQLRELLGLGINIDL